MNKAQIIDMIEEYGQGVSYSVNFETETVQYDDHDFVFTFDEIAEALYCQLHGC